MRTQECRDEQTLDITMLSAGAVGLGYVPVVAAAPIASVWIDLGRMLPVLVVAYFAIVSVQLFKRRRRH